MGRDFLRRSLWMTLACAVPAFMAVPSLAQLNKAAVDKSANEGKQIFSTICAACHGLDGGGGERGPDISRRPEVRHLSNKALLRIVREGVPGTRMPAFSSLGAASTQSVVRYLRSLQGQRAGAPPPGNPNGGRALFFVKGGCSQCHMANGQGGFMGSDLSNFGGTQSLAEIRSAITDPDRNLESRKRIVVVMTANGEKLTGLARNEDNFSLQLQTADGTFHLLNKSELRKIEYQNRSLMPDDYGIRLSSKELDDLVSYLVSISRDKNTPEAEQE